MRLAILCVGEGFIHHTNSFPFADWFQFYVRIPSAKVLQIVILLFIWFIELPHRPVGVVLEEEVLLQVILFQDTVWYTGCICLVNIWDIHIPVWFMVFVCLLYSWMHIVRNARVISRVLLFEECPAMKHTPHVHRAGALFPTNLPERDSALWTVTLVSFSELASVQLSWISSAKKILKELFHLADWLLTILG